MVLKKEPFVAYHEEKTTDSFAVRLNQEEREMLNKSKELLEQPKDSTCLKQLAWIGANVIHEKKIGFLLKTIFANKRKNQRLGIDDF